MKCGSCGSTRVYPSRLRNILERLRQITTGRQPYRCHECGWRKWGAIVVHDENAADTRPEDLRTGHSTGPVKPKDLDELDQSPIAPARRQ
jgi:hypothetical protein